MKINSLLVGYTVAFFYLISLSLLYPVYHAQKDGNDTQNGFSLTAARETPAERIWNIFLSDGFTLFKRGEKQAEELLPGRCCFSDDLI